MLGHGQNLGDENRIISLPSDPVSSLKEVIPLVVMCCVFSAIPRMYYVFKRSLPGVVIDEELHRFLSIYGGMTIRFQGEHSHLDDIEMLWGDKLVEEILDEFDGEIRLPPIRYYRRYLRDADIFACIVASKEKSKTTKKLSKRYRISPSAVKMATHRVAKAISNE